MKFIFSVILSLGLLVNAQADEALKQAIASPDRTPAFVLRDKWRHPYETLTFFGIQQGSTVVELSPGGGWYKQGGVFGVVENRLPAIGESARKTLKFVKT